MIKGLEALKVLVMSSTTLFNTKEQIINAKEIIEKELKRLEEIDNGAYVPVHVNRYNELCDKEKALEIIKNNIFEFIFIDITKLVVVCFGETSWNYYCKTQEEYDLLKEVLL